MLLGGKCSVGVLSTMTGGRANQSICRDAINLF